LLDEEGNRNRSLAEAEMQTELHVQVRAMEARQARNGAELQVRQAEIQADTLANQRKDLTLRHVSWRTTVTVISPVVFAVLVAGFMFLFWKWRQPEAASAFEKILVMVITGGLGWAAGRSQGPGSGRLGDRDAKARKPAEQSP
jgi:hypothetical protein